MKKVLKWLFKHGRLWQEKEGEKKRTYFGLSFKWPSGKPKTKTEQDES